MAERRARALLWIVALHAALSASALSTRTHDPFEYPKVVLLHTAALLIAGVGACAWLSRALSATRLDAEWRRDPLCWGVLGLLLSALASTIWSESRWTSVVGADRSWLGLESVTAYAVLFFATRSCAESRRARRVLVAATLAGALVVCAYAGVQVVRLDPLAWDPDFGIRPIGTLGRPNFLGAYLATVYPLAAWLALASWRTGRKGMALAAVALAVLCALLCALSLTRAVWLALGAAHLSLAVGWLWAGERAAARALVAAIPLAAGGLALAALPHGAPLGEALPFAGERLASLASLSDEPRIYIWRAALAMFLDQPVLGVGLDAFGVGFDRYREPGYWLVEWNGNAKRAHASLLQIAATQGSVGLAAYAALGFALLRTLRRAVRAGPEAALAIALAAGLIAFVVQGLFSFTVIALGTLATSYVALLSRVGDAARLETPAPRATLALRALQSLAWGLVAVALAAGVAVPLRANVLLADGERALALGAPAAAVERLEHAVALDPRHESAWVLLGAAHEQLASGAAGGARSHLLRAREAHAQALSLAERGYAWSNLARTAQALAALAPADAAVHEARDAYDRALALDPANANILRDAANAALALGDLERARRLATRAAELYPSFGPAHLTLGLVALRESSFERAREALQAAADAEWQQERVTGPAAARLTLAGAYFLRDELEHALALAEQAVAGNPADHSAWTHRAAAQELLARRSREEAKTAAPEEASAALLSRARQQETAALAAYRRAASLEPRNLVARQGVERLERQAAGTR